MDWQRMVRLTALLLLVLAVASCSKKTPTLNLLVWEGYADPSFVKAFEDENHCKVWHPTWDPAMSSWPNCVEEVPPITT